MPIPRTIHQIWLGGDAPLMFMETWRQFCHFHDFDYRQWGYNEITNLEFPGKKLFEECCASGRFHGASDIARIAILREFGGFYFDCDMVWSYQKWHETMINPDNHSFVATTEHYMPPARIADSLKMPEKPGRHRSALFLCNGFLGSEKDHGILRIMQDNLESHVERNGGKCIAETVGCYLLTWSSKSYPFTLVPMHWIFPWELGDLAMCRYIEGYQHEKLLTHTNVITTTNVWLQSRGE